MWETENITFECFAAQKCTIIIIDHNVWIIIRLYEKTLEETEQTGYVSAIYYQLCWTVYLEYLVPVFDKQDKVNKAFTLRKNIF